jgi:hypothetical protein
MLSGEPDRAPPYFSERSENVFHAIEVHQIGIPVRRTGRPMPLHSQRSIF